MKTTTYRGYVQRLPNTTNFTSESNHFIFSGFPLQTGDDLIWRFRVVHLIDSLTPEEFGADVDTSGNKLPGHLYLYEPDGLFGHFTYRRPNTGTKAIASFDQGHEFHFGDGHEPDSDHDTNSGARLKPRPPLPTPTIAHSPPPLEFT